MQQPARSPYASMSLLMCTAAPQRCSGWNLAQRPWSEGNSKPWPLWKGSVPTLLLQTLPWVAGHTRQHRPVQHNTRAATMTLPGNMPGSAPQLELLALTSCSLCGRTSAPSSCLTSTGIVNNTIKAVNKGSAPREKETSSLNFVHNNLKKVDGHTILNERKSYWGKKNPQTQYMKLTMKAIWPVIWILLYQRIMLTITVMKLDLLCMHEQ